MTTSAQPSLSPTILLFARGLVAILDLWPALTIAVREEWGGPESREKKTWMASFIVDEFESRVSYLPNSQTVDPTTANDPPLDFDDLAELINQIMSDEFEANIEDGSIDAVSNDITKLWRHLLSPPNGTTPESIIEALEKSASKAKSNGVQATAGAGPEIDGEGSDSDDDDDWEDENENVNSMEVDDVPQLVPREKEKIEPVVDEDGFTLVQGKGKGRR